MNETVKALPEPEPTDQLTEPTDQPTEPKVNRGGRPKKLRIDWFSRREQIWEKMNAAIDSGSPAPAVIRALQSQLDTCNQAIANEADERRERQRVKELQKELQETVPAPVPPVPAPADLVVEQRVNKLLKELEEEERLKKTSAPAALSDEEKSRRAEAVERDRKTKEETAKRAEEKAVAEELEKKEANDKRIARIAELQEQKAGILKNMSDQSLLRACVDNPAIGRGMSERLNLIIAELDQLEGRQVKTVHDQFSAIVAEQKADNARTQREYAREWEWQMSGMQTSPPSGVDLFRRD